MRGYWAIPVVFGIALMLVLSSAPALQEADAGTEPSPFRDIDKSLDKADKQLGKADKQLTKVRSSLDQANAILGVIPDDTRPPVDDGKILSILDKLASIRASANEALGSADEIQSAIADLITPGN